MKYSFHSSWEKQNVEEVDVLSGSLSDVYINVIHHRPKKLPEVNPDLSMRKHCVGKNQQAHLLLHLIFI